MSDWTLTEIESDFADLHGYVYENEIIEERREAFQRMMAAHDMEVREETRQEAFTDGYERGFDDGYSEGQRDDYDDWIYSTENSDG